MGDITSQASTTTHDGNSEMVAITAKILVATVIVVFIILVLLFLVHLYAKWYWLTNSHEDPRVVSWRRRAARQGRTTARTRGLDPKSLELVPELDYDPKGFKEDLECAVCLSEVTPGEKVRLLPKCNHGFHVTCIDKWFQSHSTCPLCRNPVGSDDNGVELQEIDVSSSSESESDSDNSSYASPHANEAPSFPTNVLFWGDETRVRSLGQPSEEASTSIVSSDNISFGPNRQRDELVIDIPRQVVSDDCLCSPQVKDGCDGEPESPVVTTLRSLRRLLSRGKRVAPSPRGSSSVETEQV